MHFTVCNHKMDSNPFALSEPNLFIFRTQMSSVNVVELFKIKPAIVRRVFGVDIIACLVGIRFETWQRCFLPKMINGP